MSKVFALMLLIGSLVLLFGYVNLKISYKYEVDLTKTNIETDNDLTSFEKSKRINELQNRENQIQKQSKTIVILLILFLVGLFISLFFIFIKK